jgi:Na+/melibiose symporter-like transporter
MALGKDCAGSFSGLMTFFRKFASAFALFIVGLVLQLSGYVRPVSKVVDGVRSIVNQAQPGQALLAIRLLLCIAPLFLLGAVIALAARNPMGREEHGLVRRHVDFLQGKSAEDIPGATLEALRRRLI